MLKSKINFGALSPDLIYLPCDRSILTAQSPSISVSGTWYTPVFVKGEGST